MLWFEYELSLTGSWSPTGDAIWDGSRPLVGELAGESTPQRGGFDIV